MTAEELSLLHTLSKLPPECWMEVQHLINGQVVKAMKYQGFVRVTQLREQNRHVIQLTEAGRFYVRDGGAKE